MRIARHDGPRRHVRPGRAREAWLGAALFGFGYLALTFGKSDLFIVAAHLPTEAMLNSVLRSGIPSVQSGFPDFTTAGFHRVRDEVIRRKLDEPIPFHFPEETPLDELLKYIRDRPGTPTSPASRFIWTRSACKPPSEA